jgi:hypothetical protein
VQRYHDEGNGFRKCQKRFGVTYAAWIKAIGLLGADAAPT